MDTLDSQAHIAKLERDLAWANLKIRALEEALRKERIEEYGSKSETLSALQLKLLDEEPGVKREEVEAESRREPVTPRTPREDQSRRRAASRPHAFTRNAAARGRGDPVRRSALQDVRR
ncbi:MAG: transposase [Anaerolineaceae bacterium]